jgi:D-alanyl-lipoteichoic acid acyltransferase DltB (MBOAT superfamily)
MLVCAVIDYAAGLGMKAAPEHKGKVLAVSLAANLAILAYYKYADFFVENFAAALSAAGVQNTLVPIGVLLPAGISFYTFQSMAYSIDVYRGELEPRKNLLDYFLAVSLFCHLVAGPVQRASNLLQQAEQERRLDWGRVRSGLELSLWGAFKKVCVADSVSPFVDKIFGLEHASTPLLAAGSVAFAVQILADFSGYTDIARGTARMLGFELMENFKHPYLAANPSEFWRRWHVSFSTWIRDYLYFSFGGSRGGFARTTCATFGAMLLSGLWHGASWNFVLWGGYHAAILTGYRLVTPRIPERLKWRPAAVAIMFGFTVFGWFLFRELRISRIVAVFGQNPLAATREEWIATVGVLAVSALFAVPQLLWLAWDRWGRPRLGASPWSLPLQTAAWGAYAMGMFTFVRMTANDFIYFQF